jgi:hypothetical protein
VRIDEIVTLIPKSKLNKKLLQKIFMMLEDEQNRDLKVLELMVWHLKEGCFFIEHIVVVSCILS